MECVKWDNTYNVIDGASNPACSDTPDTPVCYGGECVECNDFDDTSQDTNPACGGSTPFCDPDTHACVECRYDTDCLNPNHVCTNLYICGPNF